MGFRDARISAGLSVSQVMKNIGVSDAAVYQWETGVTRPNDFLRLLDYMVSLLMIFLASMIPKIKPNKQD